MYEYTAVYMLAADGAVFDTYQKKEPLSFSEWGRVARYDSMVRGTPKSKPTAAVLCSRDT